MKKEATIAGITIPKVQGAASVIIVLTDTGNSVRETPKFSVTILLSN